MFQLPPVRINSSREELAAFAVSNKKVLLRQMNARIVMLAWDWRGAKVDLQRAPIFEIREAKGRGKPRRCSLQASFHGAQVPSPAEALRGAPREEAAVNADEDCEAAMSSIRLPAAC